MENKQFQEKWNALQSKIKQKWPKFSDQDLKQINGEKNKFMNELQKKYGLDRNHAEQELQTLMASSTAGQQQQQQFGSRQENRSSQSQNPNQTHGQTQGKKGQQQQQQQQQQGKRH